MVRQHDRSATLQRQRGITTALVAVALVALLLAVGLALDVGHATLNKTRLQDATDAAALAAAKILDETHSTVLATTEALTAFAANANASGDQELANAYAGGTGSVSVTVQYSGTLPPFTLGSPTGPYVRVSASGFSRPTWFATLAGVPQMTVTATAVAGPSSTVNTACNIVPLVVCGQSGQPNFGYNLGQPVALRQSAPGNPQQVGLYNFQLIQVGGPRANNVAGSYSGCATQGSTVQTQPGNAGNATRPTSQGIDTRFGIYSGPLGGSQSQYPPDVLTTQNSLVVINGAIVGSPTYSYQQYVADEGNPARYNYQPAPNGPGVFNRRVLQVPIGDCTGTSGGQTSVPVIGFGCFFLLQRETPGGGNGGGFSDYIVGSFESNCTVKGTPGAAPNSAPGPYIIQLYRDPGSGDS